MARSAITTRHVGDPGHHPPGDVSPMLRLLVVIQHVLFGLLTIVAFVRSVTSEATLWPIVVGVVALVGWYAAGIAVARGGVTWLLVLTAIWIGLIFVAPEFVWVAFALWLLAGHFLPLKWAAGYTVVVLAFVILVPALGNGIRSVAEVIGPAIGALFAVAISWAQHQLLRDDAERRMLVASLLEAQRESAVLQDELAATQRQAGVLSERTRLSRDIHDTLAQGFSSIVLLSRAGALASPEKQSELLGQIQQTAHDGLEEARRVVGALAPHQLEETGLVAALGRLLQTLETEYGIETRLRVEGDLPNLPTTAEIALLRTAQGALANVRQHAAASLVVVTIARASDAMHDSVHLDIVDNGSGFEADGWAERDEKSYARGGYGLLSTRARLRELGGGLEVEAAPGEGTALSAHLPISEATDAEGAS